jgi:hypothetical protein
MNQLFAARLARLGLAAVLLAGPALGQPQAPAADPKETKAAEALPAAIGRGVEVILGLQEGDQKAEWPYEGVYRVERQIPVGYRVGGTAICAMALMSDPGFKGNEAEQSAVRRAAAFVIEGTKHPLMSWETYDAGYDVRGWGYTYGLQLLLRAGAAGLVEDPAACAAAIGFYITAIQKTEIPEVGGWNYARPPGKGKVAPASPFMTAPTLQALFEAKKAGHEIDPGVVGRALAFLESSKAPSGAVVYAGEGRARRDGVPGAVGRMLATESTLYLAGRGSQADVRAAVDAFIVHWDWLNQRRAKSGTHVGPYAIAPYYFYYAHYYAAQAVELLPEHERAEYRRRINGLLFATRNEDGSWNDRVFPRSANYGTAMAVMAMRMPELPPPAGWAASSPKPAAAP